MAEIQQNEGGKGKKGHQKKMTIRVDFTPMVDMNMLLITFFMLCTTMIKSQTLSIALPSNEKVENKENMNQASADDALTIIIDAKKTNGKVDTINGKVVNEVYYFFGKPCDGQNVTAANVAEFNNLQKAEILTDEVNNLGDRTARGIRKIIQDKNEHVYKAIKELKEKYNSGGFGSLETAQEREIAQEKYKAEAEKIRVDSTYRKPVIIIKSTNEASYGGLVEILDEMQINSISKYQIDNMTGVDSIMLIDFQSRNGK